MSEESKKKFCPYCGKRLAIEDQPLRKLGGDLSGMLNPDKPPRTVKTIDKKNNARRAIREDPEGFKNGFRDFDGTNSLEALKRENHYSFYGVKADNPDKPCRAMREGTPSCGDLPGMAPEGKCYFDHQKDCNAWCSAWEGDEDNDKVRNIRDTQEDIKNGGLPKHKVVEETQDKDIARIMGETLDNIWVVLNSRDIVDVIEEVQKYLKELKSYLVVEE